MASSSSLEDSESDYIESDEEESSSSASGSTGSEERPSLAPAKSPSPPTPSQEVEDDDDDEENEEPPKEHVWRPYTISTTNVYTASSSLVTINGRPLNPTHSKAASADEILFHNPLDPEFKLPDSVKVLLEDANLLKDLPDSDLLKAVHRYVAEFYTAKGWDGVMGRGMDESALLAIGVILEEYCREMIGKNGDLVFLEQEGND
ncbi:hypothetical protein TWF281_009058 [Arthrobotrys megalospora]